MPYAWLFNPDTLRFLLAGLGVTLELALIAIAVSFAIGTALALARLSPYRIVRYPAIAYIEGIRSLPVLLVILFVYFGVPPLTGIRFSPFVAGAIAMSAFTASLVAEIVRAGIESVDRGLTEAARAQGLTASQILRTITLPIALRRMMPALVGQFITLLKDTSLTAVIGILELTRRGQIVYGAPPFSPIPVLGLVAVMYFVVNYSLSLGSRRLEETQT